MRPRSLRYGIGINDADYLTHTKIDGAAVRCPFEIAWSSMFSRCYNSSFQDRHPTYKGCSVDPSWHKFSNFKKWMENQDWEGKHLDKDIIYPGNKVYSQLTCCFVTSEINLLRLNTNENKNIYPKGVGLKHNRYKAAITMDSKVFHIGTYDTLEEASQAFRLKKADHIESKITTDLDIRVINGLLRHAELCRLGC